MSHVAPVLTLLLLTTGCASRRAPSTPRVMPTPTIQVGACGEPGRDGVMSARPRTDRADRDLNGDGTVESIVVDRSMCTSEGNCYWNVFVAASPGSQECARYAGTFEAAALEPLPGTGEDNMTDIRGYWNLHGGRLLLQSYRFFRGGYQIVDAVQCRRSTDDRLECMDSR
ncbi:MAG: hypothetical protein M3680_14710 [Myxococcota bacterium]|nr:hypothetical protein [Myxococcota bacterium]